MKIFVIPATLRRAGGDKRYRHGELVEPWIPDQETVS